MTVVHLKDCGLGRYKGPGVVCWRRYGYLLVASSCYIDCGGCIQIVGVVRCWAAVVLRPTVDGQQVPIAVRCGGLDVFHPTMKCTMFKSIFWLVS